MRVQQELTLSRGVFPDSTDPMVSVLLDRIKKASSDGPVDGA